MGTVCLTDLRRYIVALLEKIGFTETDSGKVADVYMMTTLRGIGHHDINNFPSRIRAIRRGEINIHPRFQKTAQFGAMESWDGDGAMGELIGEFIMQRAMSLATIHGIGFCTIRNSNHYLCSAPYTQMASDNGYIGFIMAKNRPTMGMPGINGNLIGQSPIGYAFPTEYDWPVMLDICLAYASGEELGHKAAGHIPVPSWWGVDINGNSTTDAGEILNGTKFPIGEHKGFGLAILCELLTGVMSNGLVLDASPEEAGHASRRADHHTAIAIKADALMDLKTFKERSTELIDRIRVRGDHVRIPGQRSYEEKQRIKDQGTVELRDELIRELCEFAEEYGSIAFI